MTAVVRYWTQYNTADGKPVVLSFALGDDVNVNTIIGLPTLKAWNADILLSTNQVAAWNISTRFPVQYESSDPGLPTNTVFNPETDFIRPKNGARPKALMSVCDYRLREEAAEKGAFTDGCGDSEETPEVPEPVVTTTSVGETFTQSVSFDGGKFST